MKITLFFGSLIALSLVMLAVFGVFEADDKIANEEGVPFGEIGVSGNNAVVTLPPTSNKLAIKLDSGQIASVNDFRRFPRVSGVGKDLYHLQGLPGDPDAPVGFFFNDRNDSFSIGIEALPLNENRTAVSEAFRIMLGVSEKELCLMNIYVGVPYGLSPEMAGKNLGLSFCPGAVSL